MNARDALYRIALHGNRDPDSGNLDSWIECRDGYRLSVIVGCLVYSSPRGLTGPYTHVEVGYPNRRPTPWRKWRQYAELEAPAGPLPWWRIIARWRHWRAGWNTVYAYVPVELVADLIRRHGG